MSLISIQQQEIVTICSNQSTRFFLHTITYTDMSQCQIKKICQEFVCKWSKIARFIRIFLKNEIEYHLFFFSDDNSNLYTFKFKPIAFTFH